VLDQLIHFLLRNKIQHASCVSTCGLLCGSFSLREFYIPSSIELNVSSRLASLEQTNYTLFIRDSWFRRNGGELSRLIFGSSLAKVLRPWGFTPLSFPKDHLSLTFSSRVGWNTVVAPLKLYLLDMTICMVGNCEVFLFAVLLLFISYLPKKVSASSNANFLNIKELNFNLL